MATSMSVPVLDLYMYYYKRRTSVKPTNMQRRISATFYDSSQKGLETTLGRTTIDHVKWIRQRQIHEDTMYRAQQENFTGYLRW